ncbi:MAG: hypothetical protein KGL94_05725 [Acidobacteriota bacterium]|nr:hypothetical protein [Acidobacteriota bacterium]
MVSWTRIALSLGIVAGLAGGGSGPAVARHADPPVFVPWYRVGDISLGEASAKVEAEYGGIGHGFKVIQRWPGSVQGQYELHGSEVLVTFTNRVVNDIDFVTPYYRTSSGLGIGSTIPLGPCYPVAGGGCEHRWRGFVFYPRWKDSRCNCWVKAGALGGLAPTPRNFLHPWFFIFTKNGRAEEIYLSRSYTD